MIEIRPRREITSIQDIAEYIPHPIEQQIARHFLNKFSNARITYEPAEFSADIEGKTRSTIPDFQIDYLNTGRSVYVEITAAKRTEGDPKARQKKVMRQAAPDIKYIVLYRDCLERIQNKYPKEVNIFCSGRIIERIDSRTYEEYK